MDSKELPKRFRAAGWPSPTQVHALLGEVTEIERDDIERMLSVLVSKGLPGDSRDQTNRCFVFRTLAERITDKSLFLSYVRALRGSDGQIQTLLAPLIPRVNSVEGHAELCSLLKEPDGGLRRTVAGILKQVGGTTVFQTLSGWCADTGFQGRLEAMDVLISIGRQVAIPALASVLGVGNVSEKLRALQLLGDAELMAKDLKAAVKALVPALQDANERIAIQAVRSFSTACSEADYFEHIAPLLDSSNLNLLGNARSRPRPPSALPRPGRCAMRWSCFWPSAIALGRFIFCKNAGTSPMPRAWRPIPPVGSPWWATTSPRRLRSRPREHLRSGKTWSVRESWNRPWRPMPRASTGDRPPGWRNVWVGRNGPRSISPRPDNPMWRRFAGASWATTPVSWSSCSRSRPRMATIAPPVCA